jgi:hypothetical protein
MKPGCGSFGDSRGEIVRQWIAVGLVVIALAMWVTDVDAAYKGRIVDAETKEPIEGVVVFMKWSYLEFDIMPHAHAFVDARETLTDKEGRFSLPGWWSFNPWRTLTRRNLVTIFKSGYEPIIGGPWNALLELEWGMPKGTFIWKMEDDEPVILLRKFKSIEGIKDNKKSRGAMPSVPDEKMRLLRSEMDKEDELVRQCRDEGSC